MMLSHDTSVFFAYFAHIKIAILSICLSEKLSQTKLDLQPLFYDITCRVAKVLFNWNVSEQ